MSVYQSFRQRLARPALKRFGLVVAGGVAVLASAGAAVTDESSRMELMAYSLGSALTLYVAARIIFRLRWILLQAVTVLLVAVIILAILKSLIGIVGLIG